MIFLCLGKKLDMIQITCFISSLRFPLFLIFPVSFSKTQNCVFKYPYHTIFPEKSFCVSSGRVHCASFKDRAYLIVLSLHPCFVSQICVKCQLFLEQSVVIESKMVVAPV